MKESIQKKTALTAALFAAVFLVGCSSIGLAREESFESNYEINNEAENIYVSSADAMVRSVDEENQTIDFYVLGTSDLKTLIFDGTTQITDSYGQPMVAAQLRPGDIVHVLYNSTISKVGDIQLDENVWSYSDISKYSVSENGQSFSIGGDVYSIDANVHIFSQGEEIGLDRLINHDVLSVQGIDRNVLSIRVDSGHGYLELKNEYALVGGWIEIGQALISQVMEDMLFTVPEGSYQVRLTNTGIEEYREITIARNEITELDLSDIVMMEPEKGIVSFDILPEEATTHIDGSYVDTNYSIRLPVGIHEITVNADGYSAVTEFFEVTGLNQTVHINLDDENKATTSVSENSISKSLYTVVFINSPEDVEVYEDNIYKGIAPMSYQKTPGTHVITLRKNGYRTVSYSVVMEDNGKDTSFNFPEMEKDEPEPATVSGNSITEDAENGTVSGNSAMNQTSTVSGNNIPDGREFFPNANKDLLWESDLNVLSEEGLKTALEQIERYEETAILRENIIRIKKALEKYGYTEDYWN